jgi:hypothetical protein
VNELSSLIWVDVSVYFLEGFPEEFQEFVGNIWDFASTANSLVECVSKGVFQLGIGIIDSVIKVFDSSSSLIVESI